MTADRLTPEREAERVQGLLLEAITAFQFTAQLPNLQHAQMRGYLAEHLTPTFLAELDAVRKELARAQVELAKRPSRYRATPAEVDWYLRKILTEDTLLNYQRAIGNRAVEEAVRDQRDWADKHCIPGLAEHKTVNDAADWIDTSKDGGHYPSQLLCAKHGGFNPCPGVPRCTPREDEEAAR